MTLFEQLGLNKREAADMVDRFFGEIATALEAGDVVQLTGFGECETNAGVPDAIRKRVSRSLYWRGA
jgi:nucleoid DNA-binding protein